ncbi:aspartate/glutamate racemase family protein [Roseicyclus persicicus]|uniref:Asp/Glu racemase n=1 Tax=Roseicyclus persicicus TaxID=2650661 RepID=A0A7X6GWQ2_9RHOB|nr:aspartate/glutamate racemase family protein [Roseibacterium persicicum]NKX43790.1 Asp/Glu racemase [Roseibacterium persicicum]
MSGTLFVINPNSSDTVTAGIAQAIAPLHGMGTPIDCLTLPEGPPGIESQAQADETIAPMLRLAARLEPEAAGFVIACFGDPGVHALRDRTAKPVLGIQEAAVATALTLGQRFGIIAILPASIPRHLRSLGAMGVLDRLAGDRALGLGVAELADPATTGARLVETGRALKDTDGAEVLILGCAGMARYRPMLEAALQIPVIDPCQAAVAMALGRIALHQTHRPKG